MGGCCLTDEEKIKLEELLADLDVEEEGKELQGVPEDETQRNLIEAAMKASLEKFENADFLGKVEEELKDVKMDRKVDEFLKEDNSSSNAFALGLDEQKQLEDLDEKIKVTIFFYHY